MPPANSAPASGSRSFHAADAQRPGVEAPAALDPPLAEQPAVARQPRHGRPVGDVPGAGVDQAPGHDVEHHGDADRTGGRRARSPPRPRPTGTRRDRQVTSPPHERDRQRPDEHGQERHAAARGRASGRPPPPRADAAEHPPQLDAPRPPRPRPGPPGRRRRRTTHPSRPRTPARATATHAHTQATVPSRAQAGDRPAPDAMFFVQPSTSWRTPPGYMRKPTASPPPRQRTGSPWARYRRARCTSSTTSARDRGVAADGPVVGGRGEEARPERHGGRRRRAPRRRRRCPSSP